MDSLKELQKAWPMTYLRLDWPFFVLSDFQEVKDGVLVLCINLLGASDWCLQSGPALRNKSLTTSEPLCHAARMLAQKWKPSWKRRFSTTTRSETIREIPNKNHNIYIYMWPKGVSTSQNFPDSEKHQSQLLEIRDVPQFFLKFFGIDDLKS